MNTIYPFRERHRVYCAGPLFNEPERQEMDLIAAALGHAGFVPFVPHAAGLEFVKVQPYLSENAATATRLLNKAIFAVDVYQLVLGCGSLVLNMNGRVPDEGAVAEAAMAWGLGKPVVIYKADDRTSVAGDDNPLVIGMSEFETIDNINDLGTAVACRFDDFDHGHYATGVPCSDYLAETLRVGSCLWSRLQELGDSRPANVVADTILQVFGK
jgi:nucleoside 2-deoxyribosyltransferase